MEEGDAWNGPGNRRVSVGKGKKKLQGFTNQGGDGAVKGTGDAAVKGWLQDLSSDEDVEKCPICLHSLQEQLLATPTSCQHHFCLDCILEWAKNVNSCPVDRISFTGIQLRKSYGGEIQKTIPVQEPVKVDEEQVGLVDFDQTCCEVCGRSDREERLLLCDGCDAGYHIECLTPPLDAVPVEEWFCPECRSSDPHTESAGEVSEDEVSSLQADVVPTASRFRTPAAGPRRSIPRTRQSERVRATVSRSRVTQAGAAQHVPRYLIRSTWLDETISAVLYSPACARRGRTGEKHCKTLRKKAGREASSSRRHQREGKDVNLRRGSFRSPQLRCNPAGTKGPAPHSRITKSSTAKKPTQISPPRSSAEMSRSSCSVFGDPVDLDTFKDKTTAGVRDPKTDMSRRGLSKSALRSHQPVAWPFQPAPSRRSVSISAEDMGERSAPVPDLLGSILSGQSLLLMDSSTMVINRDGSLELGKPACATSSKTRISSHSCASEFEPEIHVGTACGSEISGDSEPSPSQSRTPCLSNTCHAPGSPPTKTPLTPPVWSGPTAASAPNLVPERSTQVCEPLPLNADWLVRSNSSRTSFSSRTRHHRDISDRTSSEQAVDSGMETVKEACAKPAWLDLSQLPRIPKLRRGADGGTSSPRESRGGRGGTEARRPGRAGFSCISSSSSPRTSMLNSSTSSAGSWCTEGPRPTRDPVSPERHVTFPESAANRLPEKQNSSLPVASPLLGVEVVLEGNAPDHHAKDAVSEDEGVVPYISDCNSDSVDSQRKPEATDLRKERNIYSGHNQKTMERLYPENEPQEEQYTLCDSITEVLNPDSKKFRSHHHSLQKQASGLRSSKNKSKPREHRLCSATRGRTEADVQGGSRGRTEADVQGGSRGRTEADVQGGSRGRTEADVQGGSRGRTEADVQGGSTDSRSGFGGLQKRCRVAESQRRGEEETVCCSQSSDRRMMQSSSERSPAESLKGPRRKKNFPASRSPCRRSDRDPPSDRRPSERDHEWHNRKGCGRLGFAQPQFQSRSRSRSRSRSSDKRKDGARTQSSYKSKDWCRRKDGKRRRSRSRLRGRENDEEKTSHSSRSEERPGVAHSSPPDMEDDHRPVPLKYTSNLTNSLQIQERRHFSPVEMSKNQKASAEKHASAGGVKEVFPAALLHCGTVLSREQNRGKERMEKRELKPDLGKMSDPELMWAQSHVRPSSQSPMLSSVETDLKSVILPIGKQDHFCSVAGSAGRVSPQESLVLTVDKGMKKFLQNTDPNKQSMGIFTESAKRATLDNTPVSRDFKRSNGPEVLGAARTAETSAITDSCATAVGDKEASVITDTAQTVGAMMCTAITDTAQTVGAMMCTAITDTAETVDSMRSTMITDTAETLGHMGNTLTTDTTEAVNVMGASVITEETKIVCAVGYNVITDTSVHDRGSSIITDTAEAVHDRGSSIITDTADAVHDRGSSIITDTAEAVHDMGSSIITDTADAEHDTGSSIITDTAEAVHDTGSSIITDTADAVHDTGSSMITDTAEPVHDTGSSMITDTAEAVYDTGSSIITDTADAEHDTGSSIITDTADAEHDTGSSMITDTADAVHDTGSSMITDTAEAVHDMGSSIITDTADAVHDTGSSMITDTADAVHDTGSSMITDTAEAVHDTGSSIITDTADAVHHTGRSMITDTAEAVHDMGSSMITDTAEAVGVLGDAKIARRPVVEQDSLQALMPAVVMPTAQASGCPLKRVTWSRQEVDVASAQLKLLPPSARSQSCSNGPAIAAGPSQDWNKLLLQERAVEEVKRAIRPFFQKKEITKEEYKEIWGKAVQKICSSKSAEISPDRVASLVKAYVEKYKFLRKRQKDS